MEKLYWFVASVRNLTGPKIKRRLDELEIENYLPFWKEIMGRSGAKGKSSAVSRAKRATHPNLNMIFVRTTYKGCLDLINFETVKMNFLIDKTLDGVPRKDTGVFLVVPDKQMEDFIFLLDFADKGGIEIVNPNLRRGDRVRVIEGPFKGIEGELIRIQKQKRVVVRLEGVVSVATTYIPGGFLEKID